MRRIACLDGRYCQAGGYQHPDERTARDRCKAALAPDRVALHQFVESESEHSGDEFEEAEPANLPGPAKIGGERLSLVARGSTAPVIFVPQGLRQAFFFFAAREVAGERLAIDDDGKDASFRTGPLEGLDLGVGPPGARGGR